MSGIRINVESLVAATKLFRLRQRLRQSSRHTPCAVANLACDVQSQRRLRHTECAYYFVAATPRYAEALPTTTQPCSGGFVTSKENLISRSLRAVLAELPESADIPNSEQFQTFLTGLEVFIPRVIGEIHPEMAGQSGDGIFPIIARKSGDDEVELLGHFCFIADQTLTPFHLKLQLAEASDEISWAECRLGHRGEHGMLRTPYDSPSASGRLLSSLAKRASALDWVYEVTFGERRA